MTAAHDTATAHDTAMEGARRYLAEVFHRAATAAATAAPATSRHDGASESIRTKVTEGVDAISAELVQLADRLYAQPEIAFAEHAAVAAVRDVLAGHGVLCEVGVHGLPTAFRATSGEANGPAVAILAEYDALPELGHACGHNVICAAAVGAFLAVRAVLAGLGGSVCLLGTPGEEGHAGKELMARAGAFEGLDAVLMVHPAGFDVADHAWLGARSASIRYQGVASHAGATPFLGRNALDAIVSAYQGLAQLRQHIVPEDRIHMIISEGGTVPGVIPARSAGQVSVRSATPEGLRELTERVQAVLLAAATATGTQVDIRWDERPPYLPVRNNGPLGDRYAVNIQDQGRRLVPAGVLPRSLTASTDLGNVSVRVPAIHPIIKISPPHVSIHTKEFASYATGPQAVAGIRDGAVALALTAADFLADPGLRADVAEAFARQGGPTTTEALLGLAPQPVGTPDALAAGGIAAR